jgi:hypothetical protein
MLPSTVVLPCNLLTKGSWVGSSSIESRVSTHHMSVSDSPVVKCQVGSSVKARVSMWATCWHMTQPRRGARSGRPPKTTRLCTPRVDMWPSHGRTLGRVKRQRLRVYACHALIQGGIPHGVASDWLHESPPPACPLFWANLVKVFFTDWAGTTRVDLSSETIKSYGPYPTEVLRRCKGNPLITPAQILKAPKDIRELRHFLWVHWLLHWSSPTKNKRCPCRLQRGSEGRPTRGYETKTALWTHMKLEDGQWFHPPNQSG